MRKTRAQEMRRLQKKLIPVNLLVCILCIVASLSLFFMPIVKVNLATIVGDETLRKIITDVAVQKINSFIDQAGDSIDDTLGGAENGGSTGSENGGTTDGGESGSEDKTPEDNEGGEGGVSALSEESGEGSGETGGSSAEGGESGSTEGGNTEGSGTENSGETGGSTEGGNTENGGSEEVSIKDLLKEIDVSELVSKLVNEIFDELKADISVSAKNSFTVFRAQNKADTLLNELFFNEATGFISNLEKTLISGFGSAFDAAGKLVQGAVVKAVVVPALKENLPKEYADLVVAEELQDAIEDLDNAKSADEASETIINYIDGLADKSTEVDKLTPEQKADITKQITELYDKTVEQTRNEETGEDNFSLEAMISVMASEMLGGVSDFNLGGLIAGFVGGGSSDGENQNGSENGGSDNGDNGETAPEEKPEEQLVKFMLFARLALADGEPTDGSGESVGSGETSGDGENSGGGAEGSGTENSGETGSGAENGGTTDGGEEKEVKKYTSYREMGEGLAHGFMGDNFSQTIKDAIMKAVGNNDSVFGYYGYIFIGIGVFIALWMILFLFAFFHMLARNKRFTMWYVKLFCAWPCIIFYLIPLLVQKVLASAFPAIYEQLMGTVVEALGGFNVVITTEQASGLFNAVLSSVQTYAWISGICYLLLWVISIFWAFPIKRKIRKLKKGE